MTNALKGTYREEAAVEEDDLNKDKKDFFTK